MDCLGLDLFRESWQNCAETKVEKLNNEQIEVARENSILVHKNTVSNEANVMTSINKKNLQSELVVCVERLPIVVKAETDINFDKLNDYSSEEEDNEYLIHKYKEKTIKEEQLVESKIMVLDKFDIKDEDEHTIKEQYFIESKIIVQEEVDIKDEDEVQWFKCSKCPLQTTDEIELEIHSLKHRKSSKVVRSDLGQIKKSHRPSNKPASLDFIRTNNRCFKLTEPFGFKCVDCTYQTHRKDCIIRHVFNHMEKTLKCSHCSYKTRNKWHFRQHQLIHVPKKQVTLHQCPECSYTSIWKNNMTKHVIKHKKPDDVTWYKCIVCCYKSPQKSNITQHIQHVHRPKDKQLIHCQEQGCSYKTDHEPYLARHIKVKHKRIHLKCERFFKCSRCSYQAKFPYILKEHELKHEDRSKWLSCTVCPYKTSVKSNLKGHMLVHKSCSEIKWFRCTECCFKAKRSSSLKKHKLIHMLNPWKIYKCSECSYKTVCARRLQNHDLIHKKPREINNWFHCYLCTLRTPRKCGLVTHILRMHRDSNGRINMK